MTEPAPALSPLVSYRPIGLLRSPHADIAGMPIQPVGALGIPGRVEVWPEFADGLLDLEGFSHVILIYHLHRISGALLRVKPFLEDGAEHGVFATRSPKRPNPIGISVLELAGVEGSVVHLRNVDILDQTPVLDIKPYVPAFDAWPGERIGWFAGRAEAAATARADERFR
jgi:tRNA (adenine37-N6)-methyltransferase